MKLIAIINNFEQSAATGELATKPLFTILPDTAMLRNNDPFYTPEFSEDIEAGAQLFVKISRVVKHIEPRFASRCYDAVGVAVSFTARDIAKWCCENSLPQEIAQSFDKSTAISPKLFTQKELEEEMDNIAFTLSIDGQTLQSATIGDMRYTIEEIISYVSRFITLKIGDLILCGVPSAAIKVKRDTRASATLMGEELLNFEIR